MKCHNCGSEPEDGVLFCRDCGSKVEAQKKRFCRECGSTLSDGVKFCGNCGASVEFVANTPSQDEAAPTAKDKSAQVNPSMPEAASQIPNTQNNVNTAFENVKSAAARTQGKGKLIIGSVAAIVVILIVIGIGGMGSSSTGQTPSASQPSNAEPTNYTIEKGSQYAYMTDEWNVYIATAVSDSIVKIEHWGKTMSTDEKVGYKSDLGTFKINDPENGFAWIDDEHTAFAFTFSDKDTSSAKKAEPRVFTININDSDKNKGSDYDKDIPCYTYTNDDWHMYRAIPLTDKLIKIERWYRGFSAPFVGHLFAGDWCVIDTSNTDTDFEWTDDEHTSFTITTKDPDNGYYWKQDTFVVFEQENPNCKYASVKDYLDSKK